MVKRVLSLLLAAVLFFSTVTVVSADEWGEYGVPSIYDSGSTEEYGTINMERLPWWVGQEVPALFSARSAEDYRTWAQADGRWGSIPLGSSSATVASAGCLVTSVAKLMIQHGCQSASSFNVATLANWLNSNYGYMADGGLYWNKPTQMVSGMSNTGDKYYAGNSSDYLETIKGYVNSNYGVLLNVNGGGHWVAVDGYKTKTTGSVYIMDSGSGMQNADVLLTSRYPTISRMHLYSFSNPPQPVSTAPTKPELWKPLDGDRFLENSNVFYAWYDTDNTTCYNLTIYKKNEAGEYEIYRTFSCSDTALNSSLPAGEYYTQIQAVNGNTGESTSGNLVYFSVIPAENVIASKAKSANNHTYELYEVLSDTVTAQKFAAQKGGHLVTISSAEENTVVHQLISELGDSMGALIGLSDIENEGTFTWVTDETITYENWQSGEPNDSYVGEDYVNIYRDDGTWNDTYRLCPFVVEYDNGCGADGDNVTWKYDDVTGTLTISGTGEMKHYMTPSSKPWYSYRDEIKSVVIDDGVTSLGTFAFSGLSNVESVAIPDSVTDIGNNAFSSCSSLVSMTLPNSVESIGSSAFANTGLASVTIPERVTNIGDAAFGGCKNLSAIEVSENNTIYCDVDGVLFTKDQTVLHSFPGNYAQTQYEIPNTVTSIGVRAFHSCSALTSVMIPDSVKKLEGSAFHNCDGLTTVSIPDSVTSIGGFAFGGCDGLTSVAIGTGITSIVSYAFDSCGSLSSLTIGNQVTSIEREAFYCCDSLTDVYYIGTPEQKSNMTMGSMNGSLASAEWHYMVLGYTANDDKTHTAVYTCSDCGETIGEVVGDCIDENADNLCDLCEQRLICYHDGNVKVCYTSNDDGKTHKVTVNCKNCGEILYLTQEAQVCTDADGFCSLCGQDLSCRHAETEVQIVYNDNKDRTHAVISVEICAECGEKVSRETADEAEPCADENNDDRCDKCEGDLYCDHSGDSKLVYTTNKDGATHAVTLNCAVCMKVVYAVTSEEACVFSDGICTKCGGRDIEKFSVTGVNMTLGNELELNIMLPKATVDAYGEDLTVTVIHHEFVDGDTEYTFNMADLPLYGGDKYYKASIRVAAAQMTDLVDVIVTDEDGNVYNNDFTTSVLTYVTNNLDKQSAKVQTLLVDMVNYGAAAQDYFAYRQELYANSNLTEAHKALATPAVTCTDIRVKGTNYVGSNLSLQDQILLNFMFTGVADDVRETMYATVSFTGVLGNEINVRGPVEKLMTRYAGVAVNQIVLADAVTPVTVTLYNADGSVYGYATDSVESYNARQNPNGDNALYTNIMKFAASALAYKQ